MITGILWETLQRTFFIAIIVLPLLLIVEWANHKYGEKLIDFFEKRKKIMPLWAALLATLPGCNVAAAVALLYTKRLVSMGTLVAAMIATSDEAIYVFIPQKFNFFPLFGIKVILAIITGLTVDLFVNKAVKKYKLEGFKVGYCCSIHEHVHNFREMVFHVARHGLKIIFFIFLVLFGFNWIKDIYGFDRIAGSILLGKSFQPAVAAIVGLIPGCGTSVVLATLYTQGLLTIGGALSGLSVASGDTLLVLLANKVSKKEIFILVTIVLLVGITAGYALNYLKLLFFW